MSVNPEPVHVDPVDALAAQQAELIDLVQRCTAAESWVEQMVDAVELCEVAGQRSAAVDTSLRPDGPGGDELLLPRADVL